MSKEERARQRELISEFVSAGVRRDAARVRELLAEGLRLDTRYEGGGRNALHLSAQSDDVGILRVLVEHGADVHERDPWGLTTVALAAWCGSSTVLQFFLEAGVDPNLPSDDGQSPLHKVIWSDSEDDRSEHVRLLIKHGANPDWTTGDRETPRELAEDLRDRGFEDYTPLMPPPLPGSKGRVVRDLLEQARPSPDALGVRISAEFVELPDNMLFEDMFEDLPGRGELRVQRLTEPLTLATGRLVASDFLDVYATPPLAQGLPTGSYPVLIAFGRGTMMSEGGGEASSCEAFVRLQLADRPVHRWVPAVQDSPSGWAEVGVDHGMVALFDEAGREEMGRLDSEPYWGEVLRQATSASGSTRCHVAFDGGNAVVCPSGEGDGGYPIYLGLADTGDVVAFLCDFLIVPWLHSYPEDG